jgi:hypothetical protein
LGLPDYQFSGLLESLPLLEPNNGQQTLLTFVAHEIDSFRVVDITTSNARIVSIFGITLALK